MKHNGEGSMGERGVTRPMEMQQHDHGHGHGGKEESSHSMAPRFQRFDMLEKHHAKTQWIYWTILILGFWMLFSPLTFDYFSNPVRPAGDRPVWIGLETRTHILFWSDIVSGLLLIFLGARSIKSNRPLSLWMACAVGVWLNAAPLLFWAPNAFIYMNGTLIGTFLIALTILIPGMPNMLNYMAMGPDQPPGWSYNPSSWAQRSILIALGFAGWMVSRYLAAFQMGYIDSVWDPFFGDSSRKVLTSDMSESWPVSDGGLGAFSYTFEFLMAWMGASSRWRTMPWMVAFFGILVIPLGLVHIFLVISQPVVVGNWCFMCLVAAAIMLPMIPLEVDEVIAMIQFVRDSKRKGRPFWQTFWKGGPSEEATMDHRSPKVPAFPKRPGRVFRASLRGMTFPVTLTIAAVSGMWLMAVPDLFSLTRPLSAQLQLAGAVMVTVSVIAMGETMRLGRYLNLPFALWAASAPWLPGSAGLPAAAAFFLVTLPALAIAFLSIPCGPVRERFGSWDRFVK